MSHKWVLTIPGWSPVLVNNLIGQHPMVVHRRKRRDREMVARAMLVYGVPRATGLRRVRFTITGRYGQFPDPDACLKSGLDALVRAGAIVDDSARWCEWSIPIYRRGSQETVIELEDVDPAPAVRYPDDDTVSEEEMG